MGHLAKLALFLIMTLIYVYPYIGIVGYLSAYDFGPTQATIALRQEWGELPADLSKYDVFLAIESCKYIGREAKLYVKGKSYNGIVFDCAGPAAYKNGSSWMAENRIAAEVDKMFWDKHPELIGKELAIISIRRHWKE